ncbi:MAG TPA: CHAP domain-containing protein [Candidatus Pelethomonas intestinigallinarum]|nr:CHAP domain-containing protein [Candidatus Pelethomonas intestinigallinarum]
MRAAQAAGCWVTKGYRPGDVVIYDFPGGAATDHCGIVEAVDDSRVSAIEGNTSSSNDADGGAVERRTRRLSLIAGAVRPTFDEEVEEMRYNTVAECPDWARETVQKLIDKGYLGGDGQSLDLSRDMVRILVIQDRAGSFDQ